MRRRVDGRQDDGGGGGRAGARVRARDLDQRLIVGVGVEEVATRARVWGAEVWVRRVGEFGEGGGREEGIHGGDGGGMRGGPLRHLGDFWGRERKKKKRNSPPLPISLLSPVVILGVSLSFPQQNAAAGCTTHVSLRVGPARWGAVDPGCQLVRWVDFFVRYEWLLSICLVAFWAPRCAVRCSLPMFSACGPLVEEEDDGDCRDHS